MYVRFILIALAHVIDKRWKEFYSASCMFPLVFLNHTRFTILKTRAAQTVRERSTINIILSLRTKWKSQSGFVENRYNTPSVPRNTRNVTFYLEKCCYFWIMLKPSASEEGAFFTLHAWSHRLIIDILTGNVTNSYLLRNGQSVIRQQQCVLTYTYYNLAWKIKCITPDTKNH